MQRKESFFFALGVAAAAAIPAASFGAGFALEQGSARGNANPTPFFSKGGEPSALYWNPAAITSLEGTQAEISVAAIRPNAEVKTVSPYSGQVAVGKGDTKVWTIPAAYLTHQLSEDWFFGFGMFTRYGLGAEFPQTWAGRYGNYKAEILSLDFAPQVAWKATDRLSLAAGLSVRYFDIELAQKIDGAGLAGLRNYNDPAPSPYDIDQNLHGDDVKPAIDLGLSYKLSDDWTFGAAYHSRISFKVKGKAKWRRPAPVAAMAPGAFLNQDFTARNYNPDKFMLGLSWDATDRLCLGFAATYTTWHLYDDLLIKLDHDMAGPGTKTLASVKEWHDAWRLSVGGDYALCDEWTLRGSYTWDQSPINGVWADYLVPGDNRHIVGLGLGWSRGAWTVEGSYFYEFVDDFTVHARPRNGVYEGKYQNAYGHAVALSVTRAF